MKSADEARRGESYVYATSEGDVLAGRGQQATVIGIESIIPEGKKRSVKMILVDVEGREFHVPPKDLRGPWARYAEGVERKAKAHADALERATEVLRRLVRLDVVKRPPTDAEAGVGRGGVWYWTGPVRFRQTADGRPIGVDIHLTEAEVAAFLAILPTPEETTP